VADDPHSIVEAIRASLSRVLADDADAARVQANGARWRAQRCTAVAMRAIRHRRPKLAADLLEEARTQLERAAAAAARKLAAEAQLAAVRSR
jgi:hypothetical protein